MKHNLNNIFTFLFFLGCIPLSHAQTFIGDIKINDEVQEHILMLNDGNFKTGKILSIKNTEVVFYNLENKKTVIYQLSQINKVMVKRDDLDLTNNTARAMAELEEKQKHIKTDSQVRGNNRLFYTETGFSLKRGESEYHTIRGIIHGVDYGVSDGVTIGLGAIYPGYLTGHIKINYIGNFISKKFKAGFDFSFAAKPEKNETEKGWVGFLKMSSFYSYGTPQRQAHLGLSLIPTLDIDDNFDELLVAFNFGGTLRVAPHWKIIYENAFGGDFNFGGFFGIFSGLGGQWFNDKNSIKFGMTTSPSFGFVNIPLSELNPSAQLPFVSYSRYF